MKLYFINKTITVFLTLILFWGLFPPILFAQNFSDFSSGEIRGFNRTVFDNHFSRAGREINPDRWFSEARLGITLAINAWELIAISLYDDPVHREDAKKQLVNWSNEELEKRFSQWLIEHFFGEAVEKAIMNLSQMLENTQLNFSWHLDDDGNILFDDKTGDPKVIRPDEEGREFSQDLLSWRNETENIIANANVSFNNFLLHLYPELLIYIPLELRESIGNIINESSSLMSSITKMEFENIAAREERIFTSRRTRDIWSLRKKSDDEAARLFTERLIGETQANIKNGIEDLNVRLEQAAAGTGDLALLGEEWLRLYKEQFERGLKAWEDAEERFFIRRIEWEQDSIRLFSEGEEIWVSAFKQFEEQRQQWELSAKELFEAGMILFQNISEDFHKKMDDARREFELNMAMRIGEGTTRVKALIDMYLLCSSAAISSLENLKYWQSQYSDEIKDISDTDFFEWIELELLNINQEIENRQSNTPMNYLLFKLEILHRIQNSYEMHKSYLERAVEIRGIILENYASLLGEGTLKDILSPDVSSEDFYLDEYQIALIRAQALILYWERKVAVAEAVNEYAAELGAGRMTEAESRRAWEEARNAYLLSLAIYEEELNKLNSIGGDLQKQLEILNNLAQTMQKEEEKLNQLHSEYTALVMISVINREEYFLYLFKSRFDDLVTLYKSIQISGHNSKYYAELNYAMKWEILERRESAEKLLDLLINGDNNEMLSLFALEEQVFNDLASEVELKTRLAIINLLSSYDEPFSGADWYSKAKGIILSDEEKTALVGNNLNTQLFTDYLNSLEILLIKRLEYELDALINFLVQKDDSNSDFALLFLADKENALFIYEVLTALKNRIEQGKQYYVDDYGENLILEYFLSGFSFFERDDFFLLQYFDDYHFNMSLLKIFNEYSIYSYFIQEELWLQTLLALENLLNEYDLTVSGNLLPDIQILAGAIFAKPGDFLLNSVQFIRDFYNSFQMKPQWITEEILVWKNAFFEYIAAYALFYNITPDKNISALESEQEELYNAYDSLVDHVSSLYFICNIASENINNSLMKILNELELLHYMLIVTEIWENLHQTSLTGEKHWRQYLSSEMLSDNNSLFSTVSSWIESVLADALFKAEYYTNKLNDFAAIYSQKELSEINGEAYYYFYKYLDESSINNFHFNVLQFQYSEFAKAVESYELSKMSSDEINALIAAKELELKAQEEIYNAIKNKYLHEADIFIHIGSLYDEQYVNLNNAYRYTDQKRFEYEKQDAIQRWASTAYLDGDSFNSEYYKTKLLRAEIVFNVLSDLYNDEARRSFDNLEHAALYSAYEQSFIRKLKIMNAIETLGSESAQEYANNQNLFVNYQNALNQLGDFRYDYSNYFLPESREDWTIFNIVTVKNGRLVFSRDGSMTITGVDSSEAKNAADFFNNKITSGNELFEISLFDEARRGLAQRMSGYFSDSEKFNQWSLARDYLLYSLINANRDLNFLRNYYSGLEGLNRGGAIGNLTISPGVSLIVAQKTNLFSAMQNFSIVRNYRDIYKNAWDSLSEEEKADLEFYIILTLHSPGNYIAGFAKVHTLAAYKTAFDYVNRLYAHAKTQANNFWNTVAIPAYKTMRDTNKNARGRILSAHNETLTNVNNWINELTYILTTTQNIASAFKESNERLESLEGTANEGEIVTWEDINQALFDSGKISEEDIADLKLYWETMQENTNRDFTCVSSAITAMQYWANNEEIRAKNALENQWLRDARTQMLNENDFLTAVDAFIAGTIDIETLRAAAEKAYGENSISLKYHQYNMHKILSNKLSMYQTIDNNFFNVFGTIGQEIIFLTAKTLESRFLAELAAREIEWSLVMKEISDKYSEWLDSAALIFERGRADWLAGFDRLEEAYKQWVLEFENEYNRVNGEWNEAYLAGLMDKERWLEMAANAANQASSEAFLFLMGTEGERLARIVDTREPLGFHIGMPETQEMINELLQASGIVNMTNAFGVINNITNTISTNVRRGMSSVSGWDSVLVKTAAAELARNINSEIADNEARKLAFNAQITAEEAVKGLIESVDLANEDFRRSMDNTFIFKGLWTRSGNNYVKDIVRGSTLFTPIISETVTVTGYANYIMEPITLKTNLDENFLAALNSVAIHGLIENVFLEIQIITAEIFGTGENPISVSGNRKQSPGSFGAHIGYEPNLRPKDNFGNTRSSIFFDQGAGEHGRLMSEYVFWDVIDRKGSAELSLAPWDRRMWDDDGSWFSSPSLRTVGSIAGGIAAGIATGGMSFIGTIAVTALISSSSEILFSSLDAAAGFKTFDEAAFSIGKTLLTNTVSGLTSGLFAGAGGFEGITSKVLSKTSGTANTIFTQTAMTGVQTLTTGLTSSVISGITYSNNDGWGFSNDVFKAGISGVLQSTLTAMTSTFTTTSLTAINSGLDLNKLIGFNKLNQDDIKNLNGLIGSLAGQGVNYALGNDFKLNVLNLNLIIGGKLNNGLLELNFGRNGTTMNIGTGGANVSIDNLVSSFRGAAVWNVNSQINRYIKRESQEGGNQFEAAITLRTQYGYGDTKQKNLLRDIIRGNVLLITDHEAYYDARTEIIDGQRVIYFGNYQQGMSMEDQFRLAVILGHEAYRDGFAVGEIDAFGNTITNESNFDELRTASIARIAMGDRIQDEHSWFYIHNQDFFVESLLLSNAMTIGNFSLFNSYLEIAYYNDKDYFFKNTTTRDNHQNESRYNNIPLFNARTREQVNEENEIRMEAAFRRYLTETYTEENINTATPFDIFRQNRELLGSNGYIPEPFVSLSGYGCKFFSMKYIYEAITGGNIDAVELHNFVLDNNTFSGRSLLSSQDIADTINKHSNENFSILFDSGNSGNPSVIDLFKLHQSERMYFAILRVPNGSGGIHFVTLDHIEFTFDLLGRPTGISNVHVANPWNSNGFLGKQSYTFTEILNWEIFMRAPAFLRQHHSRLIDNFLKNR